MGVPNWVKLVNEGRAKDFGVPWSDEELNALYKLKVPAEYVREGVLTTEDYAKALEKEVREGKKSLNHSSAEELMAQAIKLGVKVTPDASKDALIKAIKGSLALKKAKAEQAESLRLAYEMEEKAQAKNQAKAKAAQEKAFEKEKEVMKKEVKEVKKVEKKPKK